MSAQFLLEATEVTIEWARAEFELSYEQIGRALGADRRTLPPHTSAAQANSGAPSPGAGLGATAGAGGVGSRGSIASNALISASSAGECAAGAG